jgi:hypothetical protein
VLKISSESPFDIDKDGREETNADFWIDPHVYPYIYKGTHYSIVEVFVRSKKHVVPRVQKSTVALFKHGPEKSEEVFEQVVWHNKNPHNWHKAGKMSMVNRDKMYFVSLHDDDLDDVRDEEKDPRMIEYTVWRYDFETGMKQPFQKYKEEMRKEKGDEPHYACQAMLSFYVRGDDEPEPTDEEFLEKTFVTI